MKKLTGTPLSETFNSVAERENKCAKSQCGFVKEEDRTYLSKCKIYTAIYTYYISDMPRAIYYITYYTFHMYV